jgi:hypothetical protein
VREIIKAVFSLHIRLLDTKEIRKAGRQERKSFRGIFLPS